MKHEDRSDRMTRGRNPSVGQDRQSHGTGGTLDITSVEPIFARGLPRKSCGTKSTSHERSERHAGRSPDYSGFLQIAGLCLLLWLGSPIPAMTAPPAGETDEASPKSQTQEFGRKQNRLARETSPYLRMHATNPVDWYPWGPEALQKALKENKPIFLSVGYSTCFWCHVMERQVFQNEEIAAYMNEHFVNIKVDREERPDIDDVYMTALQVYFQLARSSQGGGWPLSIFLTPDGKPIAGGTYFPPEDKPGQTGFPSVLKQIRNAWNTREDDIRSTADVISREVARLSVPSAVSRPVKLGPELVGAVMKAIEAAYDAEEGGLDFDPESPAGAKFPVPCRLQLLQSQVGRPAVARSVDPAGMLDKTLNRMAAGGIWDHLGGGFHRYSTDRRWHVPHFEKMLYDNALLAEVYVEAYRRTGRDRYRQIAEDIFSFVQRELTGPHGEFYSALDAETDGVEGAYYVWSQAELEQHLTAGNYRIFTATYGIDRPAGFEPGFVLHLPQSIPEVAETLVMPVSELEIRLAAMRQKLLEVRQQRPPLHKDDKVLTAWNGLMIRAYARAGQILKRQDYLESAARAAGHLLATHRDPNGGLLRLAGEKVDQQSAFLEDYAFLVSGLLSLFEATHEEKWLNAARRLTDDQLSAFWDQKHGGFYFTANRQEIVLTRLKNAYDNEMPSGNSISAQNLVRLARFRPDETYRKYAEKTLAAFGGQLQDAPRQSASLALALQEYLHWFGAPESQAAGDGLFSGSLSPSPSRPNPQAMPPARPATPPAVPVKTVVHLTADENSAQKLSHVQARGFLNVDRIVPGQTCHLAVELVIEPEWHLNANPAQPDYLIPLTVLLKQPAGAQLHEILYPRGESLTVSGIEQPLSVYQGRVLVRARLAVPAEMGTSLPLQIDLKIQMCNDKACLPPAVLTLTGQIPVAEAGEKPQQVNAAIFTPSAIRTVPPAR